MYTCHLWQVVGVASASASTHWALFRGWTSIAQVETNIAQLLHHLSLCWGDCKIAASSYVQKALPLYWPLEICNVWQNSDFEAGRSNLMSLFSEVLELGTGTLVNTGRQWRLRGKKKKKKALVVHFWLCSSKRDRHWSIYWLGNYYFLDFTQRTELCLASKMMVCHS